MGRVDCKRKIHTIGIVYPNLKHEITGIILFNMTMANNTNECSNSYVGVLLIDGTTETVQNGTIISMEIGIDNTIHMQPRYSQHAILPS